MKRIIFFHTIEQYNAYNTNQENDNSSIQVQIVALNLELRIFLKSKNVEYSIPEDYLTNEEAKEIDQSAFNIAEQWHKDQFEYIGISLGLCLQYDLKYYFMRILRNLLSIRNILEKEKPSEIIIIEGLESYIYEFNEILKYLCELKKIPIRFTSFSKELVKDSKLKHLYHKIFTNNILLLFNLFFYEYGLKSFSNLVRKFKIFTNQVKDKNIKRILSIGSHYYQPLVNELSKNNIIVNLERLKAPDSIRSIFKKHLFSWKKEYFSFLDDYKKKKIKKKSNEIFKNSLNKWKCIISQSKFMEFFNFREISLWPIIKGKIYELMFNDFKRIIENILAIYELLEDNKFNLILLGNDVTEITMLLSIIGAKLKVPSLVIQHGITGHYIGFIPSHSTKLAVWGESSKKWLNRYGIALEKIHVTGAPRYDKYIMLNKNEKGKAQIKKLVFKRFGIDSAKKLIILVCNHINLYNIFTSVSENAWEIEKMYRYTLKVIKNLSDFHLIIKLHPNDWHESVPKKLIEFMKINNVSVIMDYNIHYLLAASDIVILTTSTVGIEALLLRKPLICFNFRDENYLFSYIRNNVALEVFNSKDLELAVLKMVKKPNILNESKSKFLNDYLYKLDGLSTRRILSLIKDLITK